jgi:hypothetical protein
MKKEKFSLTIVSKTIQLQPSKTNPQYITVSNIKIETVQSYLNRNGKIIQVANKNRKTKASSKKLAYQFQILS